MQSIEIIRSDCSEIIRSDLITTFDRFVKQGRGMLQPHQIIAEYNTAIPDCEKLKDSAFDDVLRGAQVDYFEAQNF